MDETYIGGQRKNKRLHIRRIKAKRGHGTDKLPIVGMYSRDSGKVIVQVMPRKLDITCLTAIVTQHVRPGTTIYTDGFKMYRGMLPKHGYHHAWVDHAGGEYVRGKVHTNSIEGFWGILKRKLGCIGGMRTDKLYLFVAEIVWKHNHRKENMQTQEQALYALVLQYPFTQ